MPLRKTVFVLCLLISVLSLAAGYWIAGHWLGAALAIVLGPAWWLARKYPDSHLPLVCLLVSVALSVVGRLIGSTPLLMIFSSAVALTAWDLLLLDSVLGNKLSVDQTRQYENKHLQSLALALASGLLAALLGRLVSIQIPFVILLVLVSFVLFALDRVWGYIKKAM